MKNTISTYEQQANDFAKKHGITLTCEFLKNGIHFEGDKEKRDIYLCVLRCKDEVYTFNFGQSISRSTGANHYFEGVWISDVKKPTMYDILACLEKYEVGTFEYFCSNYCYDEDSRKAEKIYKAVCKEYAAMCRLFTPEILEEMQEIQ